MDTEMRTEMYHSTCIFGNNFGGLLGSVERTTSQKLQNNLKETYLLKRVRRASVFQLTPRTDLLQDGLVGSPCSPTDSQASSQTPRFKSINSLALSFLHSTTLTSIHEYQKNHRLDQTDLCWQSVVSALSYAVKFWGEANSVFPSG